MAIPITKDYRSNTQSTALNKTNLATLQTTTENQMPSALQSYTTLSLMLCGRLEERPSSLHKCMLRRRTNINLMLNGRLMQTWWPVRWVQSVRGVKFNKHPSIAPATLFKWSHRKPSSSCRRPIADSANVTKGVLSARTV